MNIPSLELVFSSSQNLIIPYICPLGQYMLKIELSVALESRIKLILLKMTGM
jgi:hypothetical protein